MSFAPVTRMSTAARIATYAVSGLLWLTGCAWLALHLWAQRDGIAGPLPHPWQPVLMRVHGPLAVLGVFLLGYLTPTHILERLGRPAKRSSGILLSLVAAVLVASGYFLYYGSEPWLARSAFVHEWLGAACIALALLHWLRAPAVRNARQLRSAVAARNEPEHS